jgi:ABC-2 type transport system ATP-binding protein
MKDGQIIHQGSLEEIMRAIEGKVFECSADSKTAADLTVNYPIINIREESDKVFLRLVAEKPPCEAAIPVDALLEDLYLYYFNEGINKNE